MKVTTSALTLSLLVATGACSGWGPDAPPRVEPTKADDFRWKNPFETKKLASGNFTAACEAESTFAAKEYLLHDLFEPEPRGLKPYGDALKKFFGGRPYPGGWDGMDAHGYDREILSMNYADVPLKVREWIEEQERTSGQGKGLFAVYDKPENGEDAKGTVEPPAKEKAAQLRDLDQKRVVLFTPGAVYESLPLWVAEGSKCEDTLSDLEKYSPKIVDGGVVGWTTSHTATRKNRKAEFAVKAQVLKATVVDNKATGDSSRDAKDEL